MLELWGMRGTISFSSLPGRLGSLMVVPDRVLLLYCHLQHHKDTIINRRTKTSLEKYVPLTLLQGFEKGYSRFACEMELEIEHNCNILTPSLMAVNVVSFSFSWCSIGGPGVHSAGYWPSLLHLISNFSRPQTSSGLPRAPSTGCGFPCQFFSITPSQTVTATRTGTRRQLLSWLRYIIVQRPLDLWNRMFDCHQAEITVMQFTGHSLPVRQSISTHAISSHNCH